MGTINLQQALIDPGSVFPSPKAVLLNPDLTRNQKIEILKRWDYDTVEIAVAEEENMQGPSITELLSEILAALHILKVNLDTEHSPPTKQGGFESF